MARQTLTSPGAESSSGKLHVQNVHVSYKCEALDLSVSSQVRERFFEDLDDTADDYLLRIKRLEINFGGPDKRLTKLNRLVQDIKDLGPRSHEKIEQAAFILEKLLGKGGPDDEHLLKNVKPYMRENVLYAYQAHVWDRNLPDDSRTVLDFLQRSTHVRLATKNNLGTGKRSKDGSSKGGKKKATKGKKGQGSRKRAKKEKEQPTSNYQFYRHPSSDDEASSDSSEDEFSSSDESEDSSLSDNEGQFNTQKGKPVCDYCNQEHTIFNCPDSFVH